MRKIITLISLLFSIAYQTSSQIINTIAGDGLRFTDVVNGLPATNTSLLSPDDVVKDDSGNMFISDYNHSCIRKVSVLTGLVSTVAGGGSNSPGDGGPATAAVVSNPAGITLDDSSNLYICNGARVRKVFQRNGIITTVAGNGTAGHSGDGGPATAAEVYGPSFVLTDRQGNLYFCEYWNNDVRKVNTNGIITTIAGGGGNFIGDGGPATAAEIYQPEGLAFDTAQQNLYIAEDRRIRKVVMSTGIISTVAGNYDVDGFYGDGGPATACELMEPTGLAVDSVNNVYIVDSYWGHIRKVNGATGIINSISGINYAGYNGDNIAAVNAAVSQPGGLRLDKQGNIYFADDANNRIRQINQNTGIITTLAGNGVSDGYPATSVWFQYPEGLTTDDLGNVYFIDNWNMLVRMINAATGAI
jgi:trimeric autotransporter adhesin